MRVSMLGLLLLSALLPDPSVAQKETHTPVALVELFTSEGCSSCPPADEVLRQVNGEKTKDGVLVIGLSEHVSYWNRLGWTDPFSSDVLTQRQNDYSDRFRTEGPYTPQMVVNGREQLVGSDRSALETALAQEARRQPIELHIIKAALGAGQVTFQYSASGVPANSSLAMMAVFVDDSARSNVRRGENAGRSLDHVFVVRTLTRVATLRGNQQKDVLLALPAAARTSGRHHLVVFAQEPDLGAIVGVDAKPL